MAESLNFLISVVLKDINHKFKISPNSHSWQESKWASSTVMYTSLKDILQLWTVGQSAENNCANLATLFSSQTSRHTKDVINVNFMMRCALDLCQVIKWMKGWEMIRLSGDEMWEQQKATNFLFSWLLLFSSSQSLLSSIKKKYYYDNL